MTQPDVFSLWAVYDSPKDYPGQYVARRHDGGKPTDVVLTAPTLAQLRDLLPPGLVRLDRHPQDDPVIVEVWL